MLFLVETMFPEWTVVRVSLVIAFIEFRHLKVYGYGLPCLVFKQHGLVLKFALQHQAKW